MFEKLKAAFAASSAGRWYFAKSSSDQLVLAVIAVCVVLLLGWALIWKPVSDWENGARKRFEVNQDSLDYLKSQESTARRAATSARQGGGERQLLPVVSNAARVAGVQLSRFTPEADGSVSVVLQNQPFDEVMRWLHGLENNNQVYVVQAAIDLEDAGRVNARFRLR